LKDAPFGALINNHAQLTVPRKFAVRKPIFKNENHQYLQGFASDWRRVGWEADIGWGATPAKG